MVNRFKDRLTFILERLIQRGALAQLLVMIGAVVAVAVAGGLLAWYFGDGFGDPAEAVWWAFLRLTDPGYLGDDEGTALRIISTSVTILGYVLFMGSLIAILTAALNQTMRRLESGLTPISANGHLLILGWTNRTPTIVREMVLSEGRVRRFLRGRGARTLRIVILAEDVDATLRQELRDLLGSAFKPRKVIFRSGSSMRIEHLRRVDFAHAAAIILPGADFALGGAEGTDARIIKTLMSISKYGQAQGWLRQPAIVAEVFDAQKIPIVRQAFQGKIHVIAGDAFISRLIAQNVRHRGLSFVYGELLSYIQGNEVYVRICPELAGRRLHDVAPVFPKAVLLGVVRPFDDGFESHLNPPADFVIKDADRLVLVARTYEDTAPQADAPTPAATPRGTPGEDVPIQRQRRLLFLGWSHKISALLREFGNYPSERFEIDVLSVVPIAEREAALARLALDESAVRVRHIEGDYTLRDDVLAAEPERYDNIVLLGSDWLDSSEESDARTILGYVLLRALLPDASSPEVLIELIDPTNARLFQRRAGEVIISPLILSHMLAHAALRQELTIVFEELFGPGGAEIFFRPATDFGLAGQTVGIKDLRQAAAGHGEIALGVRLRAESERLYGGVKLNPPQEARFTLTAEDEIVVLTTYG